MGSSPNPGGRRVKPRTRQERAAKPSPPCPRRLRFGRDPARDTENQEVQKGQEYQVPACTPWRICINVFFFSFLAMVRENWAGGGHGVRHTESARSPKPEAQSRRAKRSWPPGDLAVLVVTGRSGAMPFRKPRCQAHGKPRLSGIQHGELHGKAKGFGGAS